MSAAAPLSPHLRAFGDAAVLAQADDLLGAQRLAVVLGEERHGVPGTTVEDVVLGDGTVTIRFDPRKMGPDAVVDEVAMLARRAGVAGDRPGRRSPQPLDIPVCFDGPDLPEMADKLGWTPERTVSELAGAPLVVAFLGFAPGFGYLRGLPTALAGLPRRDRPRAVVPAGSVAVGGGFAAVYPQATPGGWHLVGRAGLVLFDAGRAPYAVLRPGQLVRLRPTPEVPEVPEPPRRAPFSAGRRAALVVERVGSWSAVQDEGRRGVAALGVPRAGAMDLQSFGLGNRLMGNPDGAAAVEVTATGSVLRATAACHAAVLGAPGRSSVGVSVNGHRVPEAAVVPLEPGARLEIGDLRGSRALVMVSGGFETPAVLGSRSTDMLCGLGPGPVRVGDELALGEPGRPRGRLRLAHIVDAGGAGILLRVVPGPDAPAGDGGPSALEALVGGIWVVAVESNRVGIRLQPQDPGRAVPGLPAVRSRGMVCGAVQCPPGGELVVLGPDHATVGGYPVPAVVITVDHHRLAHLVPGDTVTFEVVDLAYARRALQRADAEAERAVEGWFPTRAG